MIPVATKNGQKNQFPDLVREVNYRICRAQEIGLLIRKESEFLRVGDYNIPTFYITPNVYKNMNKPLGQPIVSDVGGPMERIGKYCI